MSFERPALLLLLVGLPVLLLLLRRLQSLRRHAVTTFILFRRALARLPGGRARRRADWQAWVRLLPLLLAAAALAGPRIERDVQRPLVVLLDPSPSMSTLLNGRTRLERARLALQAAGLRGSARLVGVAHGSSGWESRPGALVVPRAALRRAVVAVQAAGDRVLLVSDRDPGALPPGAGLMLVGDGIPNAGIVACGVGVEGRLLVRVAGRGAAQSRKLVIGSRTEGSATVRVLREIPVPELPFRSVVQGLALPGGGLLEVSLVPPDACVLDDSVQLVPPPRRTTIGLPLTGHSALERAFAADPGLLVLRGAAAADLMVDAPASPGGARLLVAPADSAGFRTGVERRLRGPLAGHGPFADFPLANEALDDPVHVLDQRPADCEVLLSVGPAPLLVRSRDTYLLLAVPAHGGWPGRRTFPLVCSELAALAGPRETGWSVHRGGELVTLPVPRGASGTAGLLLLDPHGGRHRLTPSADGLLSFTTGSVGTYRLVLQGDPSTSLARVTCAVLDTEGSQGPFTAVDQLRMPGEAEPRVERISLEPWCALLAALLLLLFELRITLRPRQGRRNVAWR